MNDLGSANARSVGACSVLLALAAGLTSCGGGQSGSNEASGAGIEPRSVSSVDLAATDEAKLIAVGADLNARELESAERTAKALRAGESVEVITPSAKTDLTKAAAAELTVYRFFNTQSGAHFYTASVSERDQVRAQAGPFSYEGPAFQASGQGGNGLSPVYRFYNASTGVHFYTISETEKIHIQQTLPQFQLEGVAYYASQVAAEGYRALYRSFVANKGFHFYSVNATEGSDLAQYQAEGIAYYVVGTAAAVVTPVADTVCGLANFQADLMQQINAARASARSCGNTLRPATTALAWNANLQAAATRHSTDMAKNNFFSHTGSDGSNLGGRATAAGYIWRGIGENIAAGQTNVTSVMNGWLASEGHCNNIMESSFNDVAVACAVGSGTTYGRYWTMELGRR